MNNTPVHTSDEPFRDTGLNDPEPDRAPAIPGKAPQAAKAVLVAVFVGFYLVAWTRILYSSSNPVDIALSAIYMTAIAVLQIAYFTRPAALLTAPGRYVALAVQAGLTYIPMLQFTQQWVAIPGFLAGSVLLVVRWPLAWLAFAGVAASVAVAQYQYSGSPLDVIYSGVSTAITGLVVYGLTRLANVVRELHEARTELAEMAVANERLRVARDLHDLLGINLSAITLKGEFARRVVTTDPERAEHELGDVIEISRKALADVRAVSKGYRELSLDEEARSARSVLQAADVDVAMELAYGTVTAGVRSLLATVLREGVTNVLRHSRARRCEIHVREEGGQIVLEIINDGLVDAHDHAPADASPGTGLANVTQRIRSAGGEVTVGVDPDRRFRLRAALPARLKSSAPPEAPG